MKAVLLSCVVGTAGVLFGLQQATTAAVREQVLTKEITVLIDRIRRLEQETLTAMSLRAEALKQIDQLAAMQDAARLKAKDEPARNRPMPEAVRQAVLGLQSLLAIDGYQNIRILRAERLEPKELQYVELVEHDPVALIPTLYLAERFRVTVDRGERKATLWMHGGTMTVGGERRPLPEEGLSIHLPSVQADVWEHTLGVLVVGIGEAEQAKPTAPHLRSDEASIWFGRVNTLLSRATLERHYLLERFADLQDGVFVDVLVLAYDGVLLAGSIEAQKMSVRVDADADTVQLWFEQGVQRLRAGEAKLPERGFGLLLPGISPKDATDQMFGLVTSKPLR